MIVFLHRLAARPLCAAPHRLYFFTGLVHLLLGLLYWGGELTLQLAGQGGFGLTLPPRWLHGALMVFGVMPLFAFGFLMTAMPRWHGAAPLRGEQFRPPAVVMAAGWLIVWAGMALAVPALAACGLAVGAGGVLHGVRPLWAIARAPLPATAHARMACAALVAGALAQLVLAAGVWRFSASLVAAALQLGIWWCLAPLFLIVVHRMLPVFTRGGLGLPVPETPRWLLFFVPGACALHGLLAAAGWTELTWLVDLPVAVAGALWSWRGGLAASLRVRLLAMHHVALLWFPLAMLLLGGQSLLDLAGSTAGGLAPLHALTLGFFLSMALGMATRVSCGHSGRPVEASPLVWALFWVLQAGTVLRIAADLVPAGAGLALTLAALVAVVASFAGWARTHAAMLLR